MNATPLASGQLRSWKCVYCARFARMFTVTWVMAPSPNTPIGISATDAARREVVDDQPRRQIDHDEVVQSDIRHVRQLQELMRAPGGREHFARFMVSGHWRRPAKSWSDQRLRWIEPYWKGPDVAAVIEKAYRLRPSSAEAAPPSPP